MQQGRKDAAEDSASDGVHAPPGGISKLIYVVFFFYFLCVICLPASGGRKLDRKLIHASYCQRRYLHLYR